LRRALAREGEVPWFDYRIQFADVFAAGGFDLVMCRVASNMPTHRLAYHRSFGPTCWSACHSAKGEEGPVGARVTSPPALIRSAGHPEAL
jgi:hypothetical protein